MTKTIIIGEDNTKKLVCPIVFKYVLNVVNHCNITTNLIRTDQKPKDFLYVELICKNYQPEHDLMFAYNDPKERENGLIFIGEWNDGVVCT